MKLIKVLGITLLAVFGLSSVFATTMTTNPNNTNSTTATSHSKQPYSDAYITTKVKALLVEKKLVGENVAASLSVTTNNGVVNLSGTVNDKKQAMNAVKWVKTIEGVKSVHSTITVNTAK